MTRCRGSHFIPVTIFSSAPAPRSARHASPSGNGSTEIRKGSAVRDKLVQARPTGLHRILRHSIGRAIAWVEESAHRIPAFKRGLSVIFDQSAGS